MSRPTETYTYPQRVWVALTVQTAIDTAETTATFAAPGLSDEYLHELSHSTEFGASMFKEMIQSYVSSPPSTSLCASLYHMVGHMTPLVTSTFKQQWLKGMFLTESLSDSNVDLRSYPNLFWTLPPNQAAPGFSAATAHGKQTGKKTDQQIVLFGQLSEVNHIISALLHFAAAIAVIAKRVVDQTPAFVLACETMAIILHRSDVRTALQKDYSKQRVRCHHAFAIIHDVLADMLKNMTNFRMKQQAVTDGTVPASTVQSALQYILSSLPSRLQDLGRLKLETDSLATFAADRSFENLASQKQASEQRSASTVRFLFFCRNYRTICSEFIANKRQPHCFHVFHTSVAAC